MILLLGLLWSFWTEPVLCLQEDGGLSLDGDIRHFAVTTDSLYIATEEKMYQLSHDLAKVWTLTQRGVLTGADQSEQQDFQRLSGGNSTFTVNVLLPFVRNKSVISCGVIDNKCGFCELLDLKNISKILHKEPIQVGPLRRSSASVSFLVDVEEHRKNETFILTAIQQGGEDNTKSASDNEMINLHNTQKAGFIDIFSKSDPTGITPGIKSDFNVTFVDGFQIGSIVYLFSNVASKPKNQIRLLWLEGKTSKYETLKSLRGATLQISDGSGGSKLLASSVILGGQQVLWSGVFSVDGEPSKTQLVLFDVSPDLSGEKHTDPHFHTFIDKKLVGRRVERKRVFSSESRGKRSGKRSRNGPKVNEGQSICPSLCPSDQRTDSTNVFMSSLEVV